jgi:multicomponent Na+:H+ antiporter subunit B
LKTFTYITLSITLALLIYTTGDMPDWGDPQSPASLHVSPRYIEKPVEETAIPNMVTALLADYRGYDTLFEETVILTAGISVIMLLRRPRK